MKITVEFKSPEEREAYLGMVALTMEKPSTDLNEIEESFKVHLERIGKIVYIEGASKKFQIENLPTMQANAEKFFEVA